MTRIAAAIALATLVVCIASASAGAHASVDALRLSTTSDLRPAAVTSALAATWCGAAVAEDRAPNVVAGNPIHWVYMIPSDGADSLGTVANVMESDAEQIDAWWRGQDSTRVPRNDLATFPCGTQLDVTTVRMSRSSAQVGPLSGRFSYIFEALEQVGLDAEFTKYLVYFDGPTNESNVCGQGGTTPDGIGLAVVYYRSCVGVSTAAVAAHEFLHATGAVSDAAPHACIGENSGHTCDSEADVMYPFIGRATLAEKLLDPGRDDYYGHAGAWPDSQDSAWLVRFASQTPLALTVSGPGSVTSDVPGLLCSASCTTTWNSGERLFLSATPAAGAKLIRWGGACTGNTACGITVGAGTTVSALFGPASYRLRVALSGRGAVRSSSAGITCRPRCSATFPSFAPVRLTATPAKGWRLRTWSGACRGSRLSCSVPMSGVTSVRATFVRR